MTRCILTDIEGTTTSVSFVYDTLFPYFVEHIDSLLAMQDKPEVRDTFAAIRTEQQLANDEAVLDRLRQWVAEDRKETHLKTLQGIVWQQAYLSGAIKGHVYPDVAPCLERWYAEGRQLAVYSSGSVAAQKLLFGYSEAGDLTPLFSAYFDTKVGHKRESDAYRKICSELNLPASDILFLSDVEAELDAAAAAGLHTLQLVRAGTTPGTRHATVSSFDDIQLD